jgi:hypothetical protein
MPRLLRLTPTVLLLAMGCHSAAPAPPHGSPVLLRVAWERAEGTTLAWSHDVDPTMVATVPGDATRLHFVFDRTLDGARIEDRVDGSPASKQPPPITATWPDSETVMSTPPFGADVFYNSTPPVTAPFGTGTTDVFFRPHLVGFPSATTVSFVLDKTALASVYDEPADAPDEIQVAIAPLGVVPPASAGTDALPTVPPSYMVPVTFTNRPASPSALLPFAHARSGDVELPIALGMASGAPTKIYVSAACSGGWPAGQIDVSFDPGLPDAFGVPTSAPLAGGSFTIVGGSADAGCTRD